jgi:hypothetical protein
VAYFLLTSCRQFAVGNYSLGKGLPEEVSMSRVGAIQILRSMADISTTYHTLTWFPVARAMLRELEIWSIYNLKYQHMNID